MMLKASRPKCDLSDRQNEWYESMVRISGDRKFHCGPHTENVSDLGITEDRVATINKLH